MDLLDFENPALYFEEAVPEGVSELLAVASSEYGTPSARSAVETALDRAPECLTVLVAAFRFYYYEHEYEKARRVGWSAARVVTEKLAFPGEELPTAEQFSIGFRKDPAAARFYLQALKGIGYLCLRLGEVSEAQAVLAKVVELDDEDRLTCRSLLAFATDPTDDAARPPATTA